MLYLELGRNGDALGRFGNDLEIQAEGLRSAMSKPAPFAEKKIAKDAAPENSHRSVLEVQSERMCRPPIDNPVRTEATFGCCVGRIGADRKGYAHLR